MRQSFLHCSGAPETLRQASHEVDEGEDVGGHSPHTDKYRNNKVVIARYGGMGKLHRYSEAKRAAGLESVSKGPAIVGERGLTGRMDCGHRAPERQAMTIVR